MGWFKWKTDTHHGKERTTSSGGSTKREFFVGKTGGGYSSHVSVTKKPNGKSFGMAGPHRDKK